MSTEESTSARFEGVPSPDRPADGTALGSAIKRRQFLTSMGGTALAIGVHLHSGGGSAFGEEEAPAPLAGVRGGDATPALFIAFDDDGTVHLTCHRSEMGQQVLTSMAQILADELEADWDRMVVEQADGHPKYGDQNTDGSRSVRRNLHRLRVAGAAMRGMLERTAAELWNVSAESCRGEQHWVRGPEGRIIAYGNLARAAALQPVPAESDVRLKSRDEWRYIGKPVASLTVPKVVHGEGTFGQDVRLPEMLYAVVARPPRVFAKAVTFDETAALEVPGVLRTVRLPDAAPPAGFSPLGGIAILATDTWAAKRGRDALKVEWTDGPNADYDSREFEKALMATARQPGEVRRNRGDVDAALTSAKRHVVAEYYAPHLSQSPMEPPAAVARWTAPDAVECWGCVQTPQSARREVARACGIPPDNVTVHVTWLGGAFGRKSKPDFVVEAALIARAAGRPVKVVWTREDEVRHGYYHSVSGQRMEAALDDAGRCTALLHRTVFPPIGSTFREGNATPSWGELRLGASDNPFDIPNIRLESGDAPGKLRIGWLRSVANVYHAFAVQSFASELAHAAGRDPRDYLLELIGPPRLFDPNTEGAEYDNYGDPLDEYPIDTARLANVTRIASKMAEWGRSLPPGHGLGIAAHRSFLSYVATVIEVAVSEDGKLSFPGIWTAIDAGTVVNPRHTTAQVEGGTLYGLSNALYGEITATGGVVDQLNFPAWRLMRMHEAPRRMEVHIVASNAPPGGVGEPPTPPAAPALANAIFAATGKRFRRLPIIGASADRLDLSTAESSRGNDA